MLNRSYFGIVLDRGDVELLEEVCEDSLYLKLRETTEKTRYSVVSSNLLKCNCTLIIIIIMEWSIYVRLTGLV